MISAPDRDYLRALGLRIRLLRTARRLSQSGLADVAGTSRVTLGSIERGEHCAALLVYRRIATALDLRLPELIDLDAEGDVLRVLGN